MTIPLLVGCQSKVNYDSRLTRADSIMVNHPDSALQLLEAIDGRQLATEGDRAYHALILSQARYRCYVVATSDSLINIALDYYQHHDDEREKLTRAHIYKGGVMEELGQPEEAMEHFKQALTIAAPDDYFNQGYVRLRIGKIYQQTLVADNSDITYLKEALHCFEQVPDSFYIMNTTKALGLSLYKINKDSSLIYLERARKLAKKLNNKSILFAALGGIADIKMLNRNAHDMAEAKDIALSILSDNDSKYFENRDNLLLIAAYTLAKQHKPDSANYYLQQAGKEKDLPAGLQTLQALCQAEIALCKGNIDNYRLYFELSDDIADSVQTNTMQLKLRDIEVKYDSTKLKYENLRYKSLLWLSLLGALLALAILAIAILVAYRKSALRKQQLKDSEDTIERLYSDKVRLEAQLADNQAMSDGLKQTIRHQIDIFTQLVEQHRSQFTHDPKQFGAVFKKSFDVHQPDGSFWQEIRNYVDVTCGNIITRTLEAHPSLRESDVRFLCLCCCDLPSTMIMACMGYNEAHSVYNKKRRLAEDLGCTGRLDDYIDSYRSSETVKQQ
jgi:hypothetical protein